MTGSLDDRSLDQLFRSARSIHTFRAEPVTDEPLEKLYDLLKWGPTAFNSQPARYLFIRSPEAKARLAPALSGSQPGKDDRRAGNRRRRLRHAFFREIARTIYRFEGDRSVRGKCHALRIHSVPEWHPAGGLPSDRSAGTGAFGGAHVRIQSRGRQSGILSGRSVSRQFPGEPRLCGHDCPAPARAAAEFPRCRADPVTIPSRRNAAPGPLQAMFRIRFVLMFLSRCRPPPRPRILCAAGLRGVLHLII